jgi:hypothetical protein
MAGKKRLEGSRRDGAGGSFKRITITRVETVTRLGTADIWLPSGISLPRPDGIDDTEQLADLLEDKNAICWEDNAFMEEYVIEAGVEEEHLPEEDQDAAVPCSRDESTNWILMDREVR